MTMDQERINAMAKALLDMEPMVRTTTGGRRCVAERLLAADDAWRAARATAGGAQGRPAWLTDELLERMGEAARNAWIKEPTGVTKRALWGGVAHAVSALVPSPLPHRTAAGDALAEACAKYDDDNLGWAGVMAALAAYRSTAPAPNFAPATEGEVERKSAAASYDAEAVLEYSIKIARNGDVTNDVATHGNSFAVIYRAFHDVKREVDRQITERRNCPFNPAFKGDPSNV